MLQAALAAQPSGAAAQALAERLRAQIGPEALAQGSPPFIDEVTVAWAIEAPDVQSPPLVISERGLPLREELTRLGDTAVYALALDLPEGHALQTTYHIDGRRQEGAASRAGGVEVYRTHPRSPRAARRPSGHAAGAATMEEPHLRRHRARLVGLRAGAVQADQPACTMVFQDGGGYKDYVPTVFDNLIAEGACRSPSESSFSRASCWREA